MGGDVDVGCRVLLSPSPTIIRVLSYSDCQGCTHSISEWLWTFRNLELRQTINILLIFLWPQQCIQSKDSHHTRWHIPGVTRTYFPTSYVFWQLSFLYALLLLTHKLWPFWPTSTIKTVSILQVAHGSNWNHVIILQSLLHFRYHAHIPSHICRLHAQGNGFFMQIPIYSFCTGGAKCVTCTCMPCTSSHRTRWHNKLA